MAGYLHPDKKPFMYGEWKIVLDVFARQAERETKAKQAKAAPGEKVQPVHITDLVRRITLREANQVLAQEGATPLELEPGSSTSATRGTRVDAKKGKLVEKTEPRRVAPKEVDPETWEQFQLFQKMLEKQKDDKRKVA